MRMEKNMPRNPIDRDSFIERDARRRTIALLDPGTFRELLDPFEQLASPWLPRQGIVPQADDGVVVARGTLDGQPAVVLAIEGAFQGGSMGEVSGAKIAGSLELAEQDNRAGIPTRAVIIFETGGVILDWRIARVDVRLVVPGERVHEQRRVAHRARHRADMIARRRER